MIIRVSIFVVAILWLLVSCKNDEESNSETIPNVAVNIQINLNNQDFLPLKLDNGFVNVTGGVKGIIVFHQSGQTYKSFERCCPYKPSVECERVSVDSSGFFIKCDCCASQFDFLGNVTNGPAVRPLKQYSTSISGYYLYINN